MAEVVGVVKSIPALIGSTVAIIKYVEDVRNAPEERAKLLTELEGVRAGLYMVEHLALLPTEDDRPWLEELQKLEKTFGELTEILDRLRKTLEDASSWWRKRLHRLTWPLTKNGVEEDLRKIERIKSLITVAGQHDHVKLSLEIQKTLNHVEVGVKAIQENTDITKQLQMEKDVEKWLEPLDFKSTHVGNLNRQVDGTGRWFLESEQLQAWINGPAASSCLWCPGGPGVGKTIVASITIEHLRSLVDEKMTPVLNIFCDYRSPAEHTIYSFLRSLLHQLVQVRGLPLVTFLHNMDRRTPPSLDDLIKILSEELKLFSRVYIVLDALDEFTPNDQGELIKTLKLLANNIHLLVTSRPVSPVTALESLVGEHTELAIRAADNDVALYVKSKIYRGYLANIIGNDDSLRDKIVTGVMEKADGMFILVRLHMDSLADTINQSTLLEVLGKLPSNMNDAYDETLRRVDSQGSHRKELAYRIFAWLTFADGSVYVRGLQEALACEPGTMEPDPAKIVQEDILSSVCAGLVVIDSVIDGGTDYQRRWQDRRKSIRFVHYTTREYFTFRKDKLSPYVQESNVQSQLGMYRLNLMTEQLRIVDLYLASIGRVRP
ncbi:hypothetical protein F5146DRAFT_330709 [Armillaria mellea]|nr:hypothetical protein F5146DRAFT_330709 [Armillaria mellea]